MKKVNVKVAATGMDIESAIDKARKLAGGIHNFRVQAFKTGREWPVATWASYAGDTVSDIGRKSAWGRMLTDGEADVLKVFDEDLNKCIDTILVNG